MSTELSDRDLIAALSSDPVAFEAFYRRHVDRVTGFATRRVREPADVADLVANTFVVVLTSARSYDAARGEPTAWLLGISARLLAYSDRRRGREAMATARYARRPELDAGDIERLEDRLDAARSSQHLTAALDYAAKTWSATTYAAAPAGGPAPLPQTPAQNADRLRHEQASGTATLIGPATVDGEQTIELREGSVAAGEQFTWVDADTYLPVREIDTAPGGSPTASSAIQTDDQWLPASPANRQLLTAAAATPPGFTERP